MNVEVDQSRKIEETGDTVLAFSNDICWAILIPAPVKRLGFQMLRAKGKTGKAATIWLFAACVFLVLGDHLHLIKHITIDMEYAGREADIRGILLTLIRRDYPAFAREGIAFARVGKNSPAHAKAWAVRRGQEEANRTITKVDLIRLLE